MTRDEMLKHKREVILSMKEDFQREGVDIWYEVVKSQTDSILLSYDEYQKMNARYIYILKKCFEKGKPIMSKLIVIRGNSGSGKTSLAKALQQKLGYNNMLISQDVIRRDMLRVKDGPDTKALPLMKELLLYGKNNCENVILEGILNASWYQPLFELAMYEFKGKIFAYYYDIPFDETLARHHTKPNRSDFGEKDMRNWWIEKDFIDFIPEKVITKDMELYDTVELIYQDVINA